MGPDAGGGWQGDVTPPDEPPPTPFERRRGAADEATAAAPGDPAAPGPAPGPAPGLSRRRRRGRMLALVALAVALVAAGAVLLDGRGDPPSDAGAAAEASADADAALLALLEAVDASELAMLGFDEAAGAAFEAAASEDEALVLVGAAAEASADELRTGRGGLAEPLPAGPADDVRVAYLPHLDAWIAYLEAIAADPGILLGPGQEALILRINATAGVFVAALEEAVAAGVGSEVEDAARAILDRGFPDQEDADL